MVFDDDDNKMDEPLIIFSIFPVTTLVLATLATLVFGQSHKRLESAPSSELGGFVVNLDIIIHRHHLSYSCERHHYDKKKHYHVIINHNRHLKRESPAVLAISNLTKEDGGIYTCRYFTSVHI